jgi:NAD(P)H-hydrate epimerase
MHEPTALSAAQLRALDEFAARELGLPSCVLMENAGRNAAEFLLRELRAQTFAAGRRAPPWRVVVLCGRGGNGGDGYVLARHVRNAGHEVEVISAVPTESLSGDTALFCGVCKRMGVAVHETDAQREPEAQLKERMAVLESSDAIVDALLGAGARGAPREPLATWIEAANALRAPLKVALDLPSGLEADSGAVAGPCFRADLTITFAAPKLAFARPGSREWTGRIVLADIGVAPRRE